MIATSANSDATSVPAEHRATRCRDIRAGRDAENALQRSCEMTLISKPTSIRGGGNRNASQYQVARVVAANLCEVRMRWHAHRVAKASNEVVGTRLADVCQFRQ